MNKTIYLIPGASPQELDMFGNELANKQHDSIITNKHVKVFKVIENEIFEVVTKLEKINSEKVIKK